MAAIGGDVLEITYSNDTVGNGKFTVKAGETTTLDKGGKRNETTVDGRGKPIKVVTNAPWMFEGPIAVDLRGDEEIEVCNQLNDSNDPTTWTFEHISGVIYQGVGNIEGDLVADLKAATLPLTIKGGGTLTKQG